MEISSESIAVLAKTLQEKFGFATETALNKALTDVLKRTEQRESRGNKFSLSRAIRGMAALQHSPITEASAEEDVKYVRALNTGTTPGSYLVPTIQANEIIEYLTIGGVARSAGARIWPMDGIQKMTVPAATAAPTWEWLGQNTAQTASDPNFGPVSFDLKTRRCLVAVPNELLRVSIPAFDTLLGELIGLGAAEHEDTGIFATSSVAGGFTALYAAASISTLNTGGSANGGNLAYSDILAVLSKAYTVKAKGPFAWFMSPRTFFQRVLGLVDSQSRPIVVSDPTAAVPFRLFGAPVFITPAIPENESIGSGSNQSHIIYTNPARYIHIAEDQGIELMISEHRYLELNQTAIRAVHKMDTAYSPAAAIVVLRGVN